MLTLEAIKDPRVAQTTEGMTNFEGVDMQHFSVGPTDYSSYIRSTAWRNKKREWLHHFRFQAYCFACEETMPRDQRGFNFHHRSYKRLMNEAMTDLVPLCREDHLELERAYKTVKHKINLWDWTYIYINERRIELKLRPIHLSSIKDYLPTEEPK